MDRRFVHTWHRVEARRDAGKPSRDHAGNARAGARRGSRGRGHGRPRGGQRARHRAAEPLAPRALRGWSRGRAHPRARAAHHGRVHDGPWGRIDGGTHTLAMVLAVVVVGVLFTLRSRRAWRL